MRYCMKTGDRNRSADVDHHGEHRDGRQGRPHGAMMRTLLRTIAPAGVSLLFVACGGSVEAEPPLVLSDPFNSVDAGGSSVSDASSHHESGTGRDASLLPKDSGGVSVGDDATAFVPDAAAPPPDATPDVACGPGELPYLSILPFSVDLNPFCPFQLHAYAHYANCAPLVEVTAQAAWVSQDPSVVTVNAAGVVTAAPGTAGMPTMGAVNVTATYQGLAGAATVEIEPPDIMMVIVGPVMATVQVGGTEAFHATGVFSDDSTCDVTAIASWSSGTSSVATIASGPLNTAGVATAVGPGTSVITAEVQQQQNTATLTVTQ